jgi:acetyltransferase-like isoleucine patch superfamily enzyme
MNTSSLDGAISLRPRLQFDLLHYRQPHYLTSLLAEAQNFDPDLVTFRLHDDGSPPEIQSKVREIISLFPDLKAELHPTNRGVLAILGDCLSESKSDYSYIGAGDDATCPASIQFALRQLEPGETPLIVSDFYVLDEASGTIVYVEAIVPQEWMTSAVILPETMRSWLKSAREDIYIATHAAIAPTAGLVAAGGFPVEMKWHCDWFAFSVAALRSGIRHSPMPIGCWRYSSTGYSQEARSGSTAERDVLRQIFSRLKTPEYADVREAILSPHMTPMMEDIGRQTLRAILSDPQYWIFLRWGHFKNALNEIATPWLAEDKWVGRLLDRLDRSRRVPFAGPLRQFLTRFFLILSGSRVGRRVIFGRDFRIRYPRGLKIGNGVTIGADAYICAQHPVTIGAGTHIGNNVRLESANASDKPGVKFLRRKSVIIGEGCTIGDGVRIGPGGQVGAGEAVAAGSRIDNVEDEPLFFRDESDQILVNHGVLRDHYGLNPDGSTVA